ncbi:unnamed protein product [Citrullus colocynthis]|uniref:Uncharacterized protein n=1 Tax=Citrullus colocynthis TaxID=252529 RepID=A0ABP0Y7D6_9ROSI
MIHGSRRRLSSQQRATTTTEGPEQAQPRRENPCFVKFQQHLPSYSNFGTCRRELLIGLPKPSPDSASPSHREGYGSSSR